MLYIMSHECKGQTNYYWGRYQRVPTQEPSNTFSWVFRRKPIELGRYYISGPISFILTKRNSVVYAEVRIKQEKIYSLWCPITIGDIFLFDPKATKLCTRGLENTEFHNCFNNRLREYGNSHFVPIDKGHKNVI